MCVRSRWKSGSRVPSASAVCWHMRGLPGDPPGCTCAEPARSHLHGAMDSSVATVGGLWCRTLQIDQNETVPIVTSRIRAHEHVRVVLKIQRHSCRCSDHRVFIRTETAVPILVREVGPAPVIPE